MENNTPMAEDNQVAIITNSIEVFKTAPQVLTANRERTSKAVAVGKTIIDQWVAAWGIEDQEARLTALAEADQRSNKYLVNCSTALTQEKELRAPITQLMDSFKSMFTEAEKDLDRAGKDTFPAKIQGNRNEYAKTLAAIQEEKRKAAQLIEDRGKEIVELKAEAEKRLFSKYNEYLVNVKNKLQGAFNGLTLESWDATIPTIQNYIPALKPEAVKGLSVSMFAKYHTQDEVQKMIGDVVEEKIPEYAANYIAELSLLRDELVDKFQSKKNELIEAKRIADEAEDARKKAELEQDAEKKKRLQADQEKLLADQKKLEDDKKQREADEAQKITQHAADAESANNTKVDVAAQGATTMLMFDKEAAIADTTQAPEVRKSWKITVLHQVGWTQIFQIWFEKVGKDLPVDKIGGTKMDAMKTFCEKEATKSGTFIEGKFLRYDEDFTTVARKQKETA